MKSLRFRCLPSPLLVTACLTLPLASAQAGIHTWDVNEVFSDSTGQIQFVELREANNSGNETGVGNGTVSSNSHTYVMSEGPVAAPTNNKFFLVATQAFADLPGAPTPDAIIPAGMLPFFFAPGGDRVAFGGFDSWTFGAIPTDGIQSLDRATGEGPNSPTNYAGQTGSVSSAGSPSVPSFSWQSGLVGVAVLGAFGLLALDRSRTRKSA